MMIYNRFRGISDDKEHYAHPVSCHWQKTMVDATHPKYAILKMSKPTVDTPALVM